MNAQTNSIGVWFNHNDTSSAWTDGPVAGPLFYSEHFQPGENKDLAITGAVAANRSINRSLGGNLAWHGLGGVRLELDAHHSTAESKPTTPYGSSIAIGTAIYGVDTQTVDLIVDRLVREDGKMSAALFGVIESAAFQKQRTSAATKSLALRETKP